MFRLSPRKNLAFILISALIAAPVVAHEVELSGDVAATFHIEPGHNPKAGQPSQAWFALTRKGGQLIPLSQCNCHLAVYPEPHKEGSSPTMTPALKAVSTDRYQNIPGANIVFPLAGAYELELTGTPKNGASFRPFTLTYEVNVGS